MTQSFNGLCRSVKNCITNTYAATTLDIYSHMTDTMQKQAAVSIDRKIGGTDAQMPEVKRQTPAASANKPVNATYEPTEPLPSRFRERYESRAPDACIRLTTTSGKAASSHDCQAVSERNSTSTQKQKSSAKSNSPK